jgi:RHS repeat-associated protein
LTTSKNVNGKSWKTRTHYLGEAVEIKLAPVDVTSPLPPGDGQGEGVVPKSTVLLHISVNGQRIATQTLGSLADILKPAAGTVWGLPYNQLPPLAAVALLLALLVVHFPRSIVMPGLTRHPGPFHPFALRLSKGAVVALVLIIAQITTPPLALAGDSGTPALPASDTDYLVYYHGDHLSSAQLITEGKTKGKHAGITYLKGDVIQRFEYAAFGRESFALNPNLSWDPAFTGQQYDIETGLYYYRARYYNPILGRFIQPDTIVQDPFDPQSWNRYAYVRNNPLKYVDPSGHTIVIVLDQPGAEQKLSDGSTGSGGDPGVGGHDGGQSYGNNSGGLVGASVSIPGPYVFGGLNAGNNAWNILNSTLNLVHGFNRVVDVLSAGAVGFDRVAFGGYADIAPGSLGGQSWWNGVVAMLDVAAFSGLAKLGTVGRTGLAKGARFSPVEFTRQGEQFVRVASSPSELNFSFSAKTGVTPGTYAFPEAAFQKIGMNPSALKNFGDLPKTPQFYRIIEPPPGTPIQRGVVPGREFGGIGNVNEVFFPEGF